MIFGFFGRVVFGGGKAGTTTPPEPPKAPTGGGGGAINLSRYSDNKYQKNLKAALREEEEIIMVIMTAMELIQ